MKKLFLLLSFLSIVLIASAQSPRYFLNNSLVFNSASNNTIPYPFVGGFISPQFSNIDLDADGKKDLFVFDRSSNKVLTFLHPNGQGSNWIYAPGYEFAFPNMHSWALLADYNGDGKEDIFTAADAYFHPQAVAVYKNISTGGIPKFQLVEKELTADQNDPALPEAPIFWIADDISAIDDVDGDGDLDILSFNSSTTLITLYGNEAKEKGYPLDSLTFRFYDGCWGGFSESNQDRSITLGVPCFSGRYYTSAVHAGSTMLLLDVDDDNDKDLLLGDATYDELTLLYNGKSDFSHPIDSIVQYDTVFPKLNPIDISTFPAAFYIDANIGSNAKDLVVAPNADAGVKNKKQIWLYKNNGTNIKPDFVIERTNFLQELTLDFGSGVTPRFVDADGDGDLDMLVAHRGEFTETFNKADRISLFKNTGGKTNAEFTHDNVFDYLDLIKDSIRDLKPTFGDLNDDGKQDMVIGNAEGQLYYYQNNSITNSLSFAAPVKKYMDIDVGTAAVPQLVDLDKDNLIDLVIGKGNGFLAFYKNTGTATSPQFSSTPTIDSLGKVLVAEPFWQYKLNDTTAEIEDSTLQYSTTGFAAPYFADLDNNGNWDLVVGAESGKLWLYSDIKNINDSFIETKEFVLNDITEKFDGIDFGSRIIPAAPLLSDSTNARPILMMGNFRGGINFLNTRKKSNSIPTITKKLNIQLFPNPTTGAITITRDLQQYSGVLTIHVTDILGRDIYQGTLQNDVASYTLYLETQKAGVYFVTLSNSSEFNTVQRVSLIK